MKYQGLNLTDERAARIIYDNVDFNKEVKEYIIAQIEWADTHFEDVYDTFLECALENLWHDIIGVFNANISETIHTEISNKKIPVW